MLEETDLLRALQRHWEHFGKDEDITHEIYHDDAVLEFPQSGERFEGVRNFRSYVGAPWMFSVNLLGFRGDRVAHERIYIMDRWDAPGWRAPWRADGQADPDLPTRTVA